MFLPTDALKVKAFMVVSGVLLVALLAFWVYHAFTVGLLKSKVAEQEGLISSLNIQVQTLMTANEKMAKALDNQNLKVKALLEQVEASSRFADAAVAKAKAEAKRWKAKYAAVLDAPPTSSDTCQDLSNKVEAYLQLRRSEVMQ